MSVPPGTELVYVSFSAEVNAATTETLIAAMANCANLGVKRVCLAISTPGGNVMNGLNVYNVLQGLPFELTTHNVGNVDSIGNVMFLAGAKRYATPNATFMFHGVGFDALPGQRLEEKNLRELLDGIASNHKRIGSIIVDHSTLSDRAAGTLFREAQTKDADWAMANGIIHEIKDFNATPGAPIIPLIFQR
jgi:ATP-dependent Clp protease, protease subunit